MIQKISALLVVSASLSMAGVIDIYTDGGKKPSTSLNLTTIDSLTFSGKGEKKEMEFSGKAKQKAIKLSDIDQVKFSLKDKSKETMTVKVGEGVTAGKYTFKLSEIKKIEIVEMDADEDMDSDGLSDLDEIYKYDTNPKSADTDGDGWSDSEELADGMYSPTNPTKFNPRIADVPGLRVTLKKSPSISLNITTSEGKSTSETITEGKEVSQTSSTSYEQTRSTDIMHAWELSTTQGWEVDFKPGASGMGVSGAKYTGSITAGYNGSYTSSTGMSWGSSEEKSVTQSYEKAIAKEKSEGSEINGATLCMQVELKNTSDIAFTIEALKLSASTYDIKDTSSLKILADLNREGDWSDITLKPGESVNANFCNSDVKIEKIEALIYNTNSVVLGSSSQKITFDAGNSDFTKSYTNVAAKTADITIDYGPGSAGNASARYQVATSYRYNLDHKGTDDLYAQTTLAELLRNAHVDFKQDSVEGPSKKKFYGLASIDKYTFNLKDSAMWYVTIQRAADIKKGINTVDIYSLCVGSYDMEKIFVGAGDAVHIFYSKDQDHDGVPLTTEHLFGTDDKKVDSDGDGLSDCDEITGWTKGESKTKIYTSPTNADTDGDGLKDKEDPEPTKRSMFKDASLSMLQLFASDPSEVGAKALLSKDSAALANANSYSVFVQAPIAYIKVKPNAKKVSWVKFKATTDTTTVLYVQPDANGVYSFKTPGALTISKNSSVKIEVKSEDEAATKTYTLSISSSLTPPTGLKLGKTSSRDAILVIYDRAKDTRVDGYVILRGESFAGIEDDPVLPDSIKNGSKISNNGTYEKFLTIIVDNPGTTQYKDTVGAGSNYFDYRVFAYHVEGDSVNGTMVFSKGTEQHQRSVGRLTVKYKMTDFGAEYYHFGGCRADITGKVTIYEGSSTSGRKLDSWEGFDYNAGLVGEAETIVYLSREFDKCDNDKDEKCDKKPYYGSYTSNVGKAGMYLHFDVTAACGDYTPKKAVQGIFWPYEQMRKVLNGETSLATGKSGDAPKRIDPEKELKEDVEYLVGAGGIEYNDGDNVCDGCGDEPHAGFCFGFTYYWRGDDDFY